MEGCSPQRTALPYYFFNSGTAKSLQCNSPAAFNNSPREQILFKDFHCSNH
jgi:hypothetical protein